MNTKYISETNDFMPTSELPQELLSLSLDRDSTDSVENLIILDLPDECPGISPNEILTLLVHTYPKNIGGIDCAGKASVMLSRMGYMDSLMGGISTRTMLSSPPIYLSKAGVLAIERNTIDSNFARWRLSRPKPHQL